MNITIPDQPNVEIINGLTRTEFQPGVWQWQGAANGTGLVFVTRDPDLRPTVRGISDGRRVGAEMVDQDGRVLIERYQVVGWATGKENEEMATDLAAWLLHQIDADNRMAQQVSGDGDTGSAIWVIDDDYKHGTLAIEEGPGAGRVRRQTATDRVPPASK